MWQNNVKWAGIGAVDGIAVVTEAVTWFFGPGGLMPDDRIPEAYGIPIGIPLGAYLGWRTGPDIGPWLRRLRHKG